MGRYGIRKAPGKPGANLSIMKPIDFLFYVLYTVVFIAAVITAFYMAVWIYRVFTESNFFYLIFYFMRG